MVTTKGRKEAFARFFEEPSREGLRELLAGQEGEFKSLDFKGEWPAYNDLARHILGFANSGGGCLVVGLAEQNNGSFTNQGLTNFVDSADIMKGIQKYLPSQLWGLLEAINFGPYKETEYADIKNKMFQIFLFQDAPNYIPFVATADGGKDGRSPRRGAVYARRGTMTEEATYEELQDMLNRRLDTQYSSKSEFTLEQHLAELKSLYKLISPYTYIASKRLAAVVDTVDARLIPMPNPNYPKEEFDGFVARLIDNKKRQIEALVGMQANK